MEFSSSEIDDLCTMLGLGEDATADDIVAVVRALVQQGAPADATAGSLSRDRSIVALASTLGLSQSHVVDVARRMGARTADEIVGRWLGLLGRWTAAQPTKTTAKPAPRTTATTGGLTPRQIEICREAKCDPRVFQQLKGGLR